MMNNNMTAQERENAKAIITDMVEHGYWLGTHDIEWFVQFGEEELARWRERFFRTKGLA